MTLTRRRFLATSSLAATAAYFDPRTVYAQQTAVQPAAQTGVQANAQPDRIAQARAAAATAKITTQKLRGNVYALMGSGGNIAVLPGAQGKLLVDSGFSTSQAQITEALNAITADSNDPHLTRLINTHWHFDHTDGNEWMHAAGATIIAHEKTKTRLSMPQTIAAFHLTVPAAPAGAMPTLVFADKHTVKLNGSTLLLTHYDPAHTDTDISVLFSEADVLHTGDTWFNGFYPFIDYSSGGNIDGMIGAAKRNLATGTGDTIIIPGHGPIGNKTQLSAYHDMLVTVRGTVAALKQQGKSLDETVATKPTAAFDDSWGKGMLNGAAFTGLVYQGV